MELAAHVLLEHYSAPSLQQMLKEREIAAKSQSKPALVKLLSAELYRAERVQAKLADLAPVERLLLDRLILLGGDAPTGLLRRVLASEGLIDESPGQVLFRSSASQRGTPWTSGSRKFEDVVARLGVLGLVFSGPIEGPVADLGSPGLRLLIPEGILRHLPRVEIPLVVVAEAPEVAEGVPGLFSRDTYILLGFTRTTPLALTTRGQVVKRSLVAIDGALRVSENAAAARSEDDLPRFSLLRALAEDLGILALRNNTLVSGEEAEAFLKLSPGDRMAELYRRYQESDRWCELTFVEKLGITRRSGVGRAAPPPIVAARRRVIAEVAGLPPGQWIPLAHLVDRLKQQAYEFLIPRPRIQGNDSYPIYYVTNPYAGENPLGWVFANVEEATGWDVVEAGLIRRVIDALHWLGLLDLGLREGRPADFRINPLGARLLHGEGVTIELPPPRVVVQPNYQIFAFEPIDEAVLYRLDGFAERVRTESAVEYRLTKASVYRAQHQGLTTTEILGWLERLSSVPLPQNVRRTVEEWGAQHERIVVRRGVGLLHAVDAVVLDSLYEHPTVGPLLGRRVALTAAVVPVANLEAVYRALLANQRLPSLGEGTGVPPGSQITVDRAGKVSFHRRLPNLFVLREVRSFAEEATGGYQLTSASLRQAARNGLSADEIIAKIEKLQNNALSAEAAELIRRWAKNWGTGALAPALLLQVETPEILRDLFAVPEIRRLLQPIPGVPTLALVRPESADTLRALLAAQGMELAGQIRAG